MLDLIKKIMGRDTGAEASEQDALTAHLALTVLLLEAAYADGECSREELDHLAETLVRDFGVPRADIESLLDDGDQRHKSYVDLFRYTRFINDQFSEDQKMKILESVWQIILLDGDLEAHEDHFAHKLANLLNLGHSDLIAAKARARKRLS